MHIINIGLDSILPLLKTGLYTIWFTTDAGDFSTTTNIQIVANVATSLSFLSHPFASRGGEPFAPQPQLVLRDAQLNVADNHDPNLMV